jgi:uncharacterized protein YjbI with pentapeptide repeats
MNVNEITKLYATGERNFQRINLQDAELTNANLEGVDFSYADLRQTRLGKTNFSKSCLRQVK